MKLTPRDKDKLLIFTAGLVAERRKEKGLKLNHPEAIADLMGAGREILTRDDVMDGVADMIDSVQVEVTFPDGTKLVTVNNPIV